MTPGARIQASIELLDQIFTAWQSPKRFPADKLLEQYFKSHRYIGSKDRGAISELVYWCLRHKAALEWWVNRITATAHLKHRDAGSVSDVLERYAVVSAPRPDLGRLIVLAALMLRKDYNMQSIHSLAKDSKFSPAPLTPEEITLCEGLVNNVTQHPDMPPSVRLNYPKWLEPNLRESLGGDFEKALRALNEQAPTDLRVNTLKTTREECRDLIYKEGFEADLTPLSPVGLRLKKRAPIFTSAFFKAGLFEVQDEGSQMVALLADAQPGMKVIDFCAGAGGKTLAIAAAMKNKGRILAWDNSEKRLKQIVPRLKRAGVDNVQTHVITSEHDAFIKRHKLSADRVLVDAPCSGTGTWRRNPDLKWRFTAQDLQEVTALQQSILQSAARLVKPGGRLIYATCSILKNENEDQIAHFLKSGNNFRVVCAKKVWDKLNAADEVNDVSYLWLTPHQDGVDGFFAAVLERVADDSSDISPVVNEI